MMFDYAMFNPADSSQGAGVADPKNDAPVVAVATSRDLAELHEWLAGLAPEAYGRVFIEGDVADGLDEPIKPIELINAPDRVGVTWLRPGERPGAALSTAVDAWLIEWLWVDATEARTLQMFTAQHAAQAMAPYLKRFECKLEKRWPGCSRESCPKLRAAE